MPNETKKTTKKPSWSATRKELNSWGKPELITLIKDLYDSATGNRDFIQARCSPVDVGEVVMENYRNKIVQQFFPARGEGKLKLGEARKAIRDYTKATGNIPGTAELLMTYVENGAEFTNMYGDIDERFYSSIESALNELATLLRDKARNLYPQFSDRLTEVEYLARPVGWGFCDFVTEVVGQLEDEPGTQ